jgi:hypothetical protein
VVNDGRAILFTSVPSSGVQRAHVEAVEVDTGKRQVLIEGGRFGDEEAAERIQREAKGRISPTNGDGDNGSH